MIEKIKQFFCTHKTKMCNINKYILYPNGDRVYRGFDPGIRCVKCGKLNP